MAIPHTLYKHRRERGHQQRVAITAEALGIGQITGEDSVREFCGKLAEGVYIFRASNLYTGEI